jgi:hypothetical protein
VGAPPAIAAGIGGGVDIVAGGGVGGAEKAAVKITAATVKGTEAAGKAVDDTARLGKDVAQAERVIKDGKEVASTSETAGRAAHAAQPGKADLDAFWGRVKVSPNQMTRSRSGSSPTFPR